MQQQKIIACYNATANEYADALFGELAHKPLDRLLLKQFAAENRNKGIMVDLGCGPGQTTRFLADNGVKDIIGIDISERMIAKAKELNPDLKFATADMLKLDIEDSFYESAVAFYAIVHFNADELALAFTEISRVLKPGGQFLLSFHIGDEVFHRDEFFGAAVDVDFFFFPVAKIVGLLKAAAFKMIDIIERYPYDGVEHPTKRAYIWVEKI